MRIIKLKTSDFYYDLPEDLIAQTPVEPRDSSRLLVYNRSEDKVEHKVFNQIGDYLKSGDLLVINTTKVYPQEYSHTRNTAEKSKYYFSKELI